MASCKTFRWAKSSSTTSSSSAAETRFHLDCEVVSGRCSANESLLTGESDLVAKKAGDRLMSGSFVSAGSCRARVTAVGADNYATKINNAAKVFRRARSDIMDSLNKIIRIVTVLLFPIGALLVAKEMTLGGGTLQTAILHTSAALVGMIPQGLILLTSAVLAVSVIRLAQHKVLVQELYCVADARARRCRLSRQNRYDYDRGDGRRRGHPVQGGEL